MLRFTIPVSLALVVAALPSAAQAQTTFRSASGYSALVTELGAPNVPTGAGILVGQVESSGAYVPSPGGAEFTNPNKNLMPQNAASGGNNSHANNVGWRFYGNTVSVAPGVTDVQNWRAIINIGAGNNDWANNFLHVMDSGDVPESSGVKVWSHAWIGQANNTTIDTDFLARIDYSVNTNNAIHVVGIPNTLNGGQFRWFSDAMNVISVGINHGAHFTGTQNTSGIYTSGRTAPNVVAEIGPSSVTSFATGYAAGAATFLVDTAQEKLTGQMSTNGQQAETIKAAMMAGADRVNAQLLGGAYTVNTTNGLSSLYGAGYINVYNGYHILADGEQNAGNLSGQYGFDYNPSFSYDPINPNNSTAYTFKTSATPTDLFTSLVWNANVPTAGSAIGTATLNNLNLGLYDITNGGNLLLASNSTIDNTENIIYNLASDTIYQLRVTGAGASTFTWDYALAWRFTSPLADLTEVPEPSSIAILVVGSCLLVRRRRRLGQVA